MAAEEKSASAEAAAPPPSPAGGGGNKILVALTGVNILATLGMMGVMFVSLQKEKHTPAVTDIVANEPQGAAEEKGGEGKEGGKAAEGATKKASSRFGKMVKLEQFTVNLSTPGSATPKFVRVDVSLEVPSDDAETEVTQKMPQVRNAIIDLVNSKRVSDLSTAEGRDYLKEEIRNALNSFIVSGKVKGVFFTNFAVSS